MNRRIRRSILGVIMLTCLSGAALSPVQAAGGQPAASGDRWNSDLYLYLWGVSLKGTAGIRGTEVEVDESFSDFLDNLAGAFAARFESYKGSLGYYLDGFYVKLDPSANTPAGNVEADVRQTILEAGGAYYFSPVLQALLGVRYQDLDLDLRLPNGTSLNGNEDWVDLNVGFRFVPLITDKWRLWFRGDVSMFGDSEFTWNAVVGTRYNFSEKWSGVLAYRYFSNDIEDKDRGFKWDVGYSGLGIAVGYSF